MSAAVRRMGLHVGISDSPGLRRCPDRQDRGRLHRGHEADHLARVVRRLQIVWQWRRLTAMSGPVRSPANAWPTPAPPPTPLESFALDFLLVISGAHNRGNRPEQLPRQAKLPPDQHYTGGRWLTPTAAVLGGLRAPPG